MLCRIVLWFRQVKKVWCAIETPTSSLQSYCDYLGQKREKCSIALHPFERDKTERYTALEKTKIATTTIRVLPMSSHPTLILTREKNKNPTDRRFSKHQLNVIPKTRYVPYRLYTCFVFYKFNNHLYSKIKNNNTSYTFQTNVFFLSRLSVFNRSDGKRLPGYTSCVFKSYADGRIREI